MRLKAEADVERYLVKSLLQCVERIESVIPRGLILLHPSQMHQGFSSLTGTVRPGSTTSLFFDPMRKIRRDRSETSDYPPGAPSRYEAAAVQAAGTTW